MTEHEPRPAPPEPATAPAPTVRAANGSAPPPAAPPEEIVLPPLAPKGHESAATVIRKPTLVPPSSLGQWATLIRGKRLAHFELEEPLGVGGMAAVIRAKDTLLDRIVALKILPPEMAADAENIQRFHNEARAAAQLDHENIARVYFYGEDQGLHFIAFEYVDGETLQHRLERHGRLPVPEALQITLQIASGLVHAAARGMVHRDIKPSNIIVSKSGRAKLVDMGLARSVMRGPDQGLTQSGMTLGTFDYISPEQALDPRTADCRSDLYSLGCSLYQMLTGRLPVPEGTAARKLHAHQSEAPIDPRQLNPEIPDEVAAVLARMMAKDPRDRYQRPEYLVQHLLQLLGRYGLGGGAAPEQGQLFVDTILPRPPQQDRGKMFLVAVCILLGWLTMQRLLFPAPMPANLGSFGQPEPLAQNSAPQERILPGALQDAAPPPAAPTATPRSVQTAAELQQALRQFTGEATIQLASPVFDLTANESNSGEAALVFTQGNLTLDGGERRSVLRLKPPVLGRDLQQERILLNQRGGTLTLRRLRIELEGGAGFTPLTALVVQGGHLTLEECELVQKDGLGLLGGEVPMTILRAERGPEGRTTRSLVDCKQCIFYGGQSGLLLEESAFVHLEHCVFGPYQQPLRLKSRRPTNTLDRIDLEMIGCSCVVTARALIATDNANCRLVVRRSVVSVPKAAGANLQAYLLVQNGNRRDQTELQMAGNYFHGLHGLVAAENADGELMLVAGTLEELAQHKPLLQDDSSIFADASPWAESDPTRLLADLDPRAARNAFKVLTTARDLRLATTERIKGAQSLLGEALYPGTLEPLPVEQVAPAPNPRQLIVDGQGMKPGYFPTLSSALGAVETEKEEVTILLKVNGPIPVRSLDIGSRQIVLRAAPEYKPELVLHADTVPAADGEASLFRLHDGTLHLEQLGLRLDGTLREMPQGQSLVTITGTGRCRLRSCQATLLGQGEARSAVIALSDPTGSMSGMSGRTPRPGVPVIEVEDSLLRGRGDFLAVRASRPFQLDMRNDVVALFGSLLSIEGNRGDAAPTPDIARVSLSRVTAYVTQSLISLKSNAQQTVHVPVRVMSATASLLVVADGNPLVRVDGTQNEMDLKRRLQWQGKGNGYCATGSLLVWQPLDRTNMPRQYNRDGWGELWGRDEEEPRYARDIKFAGTLPLRSTFADLTPTDLRVTASEPSDLDLAECGADLPRIFYLSPKLQE